MTITIKFTNPEHTAISVHLDPGDAIGNESVSQELYISAVPDAGIEEMTISAGQPKEFSVGMDPGNEVFKAIFPNAKTERNSASGFLQLTTPFDLGTPAYPVFNYEASPEQVPASIPMYRAKIILQTTQMPSDNTKTVWEAANEFIASIPDNRIKLIAYTSLNDAPDLYRDSPTLAQVIAYLKSVDNKVDDDFIDLMFFEAMALPI